MTRSLLPALTTGMGAISLALGTIVFVTYAPEMSRVSQMMLGTLVAFAIVPWLAATRFARRMHHAADSGDRERLMAEIKNGVFALAGIAYFIILVAFQLIQLVSRRI